MSLKRIVGTNWKAGRQHAASAQSHEGFPPDRLSGLGFRLVYDQEDRAKCRGGSWGNLLHGAGTGWSAFGDRGEEGCNLGFRLVVDWRDG